jgi:hypothetical protein
MLRYKWELWVLNEEMELRRKSSLGNNAPSSFFHIINFQYIKKN